MNVTAATRVPAHVARPTVAAGGAAPVEHTDDTAEQTRARGGSDTPFTHAINRGNGKKVGIHRRMPTVEDIYAEQAAAGLGPDVPGAIGGVDPSLATDSSPVDELVEAAAATVAELTDPVESLLEADDDVTV